MSRQSEMANFISKKLYHAAANGAAGGAEALSSELHTLGLFMGTSYQSSADYYMKINDMVNHAAGGLCCAPMSMHNANFATISQMMEDEEWSLIGEEIWSAADNMKSCGAEAFLICSNTLHYAIGAINRPLPIPVIHIGDCVARAISAHKLRRILLLGTKFTMSQSFMLDCLKKSGAEILVPTEPCQGEVNRIIFSELCHGRRKKSSQEYLFNLIKGFIESRQIDGVVLGCTELEQLLNHGGQARMIDLLCARGILPPRFKFIESMQTHAYAAANFVLYGTLPQIE